MKDNINYEAPEDWGVSSEDAWVSFEELRDNGAPVLEGRDVVGFIEFNDELVPEAIRKTAKPGTVYKSRATGATLQKQQSGRWKKIDSTAQRMAKAVDSGKVDPRALDREQETTKEQKPKPKPKPKQEAPIAPKPERETEVQREATEKAQKEVKQDSSVESYRQSEVFKKQAIFTSEQFMKAPPHALIKGAPFVDIKKRLSESGAFPEGVNFPPAYLDLLSQLSITKARGIDGPPLSDYIKGAGAGQPMSQAGELMTMAATSMSDEQADVFFKTMEEAAAKGSVVDPSWIKAARQNRDALQRALTNNYGGGQVVAASWDVQNEVEAMGLNYEDKGFSTDAFFRVKLDDGQEVIFEASLKKDKNVFFINAGAASLAEQSIKGMPSESPIRRQLEGIDQSLQDLRDEFNGGGNFTKNYPKILKKMSDEEKKRISDAKERYAELSNKRRDFLKEHTSSYNSDVYMDGLAKHVYAPAAKEILENKDALDELERVSRENKVDLDKYVKGVGASSIEEALQIIADTPPEISGEKHKKLLAKVFAVVDKNGSNNDVLNKYSGELFSRYKKYQKGLADELSSDTPLRSAVIGNIRKEFPLKAVLNGEEVMAIGDANFDLKTAERIFGTNDINEINQRLTIKTDKSGSPMLVYSAGEEGEEIPVATVLVRQRGIGYASMGFESAIHPKFYDKLQSAVVQENLGGVNRVRYTKAEAKKGPRDPAKHIPEGRSFMEDKKLSVEDYLEVIKLSRNPEYADSMVYYKGKVLGRCPAGTTKIGKTCAPAQKDMQATKYKKNVLGGLSRKQVEKLAKAKNVEQVIEAHKEKEKEENND